MGRLGSGDGLFLVGVDGDAVFLGDFVDDGEVAVVDAFVVVAALEVGKHVFVEDAPGLGVGDAAFEAVADFDAGGAVVDGDEDDDAVVFGFVADAPLPQDGEGVVGGGGAFEAFDDDGDDVGFCFAFELGAEEVDARFGVVAEDAGVVADEEAAGCGRGRDGRLGPGRCAG